MNDAKNNVEQSQRKLNSLREGQKDRLKRFGSKVPELLRKIETAVRRGRFHKAPKGPVGMILLYTARNSTAFASCNKSVVRQLATKSVDFINLQQKSTSNLQSKTFSNPHTSNTNIF